MYDLVCGLLHCDLMFEHLFFCVFINYLECFRWSGLDVRDLLLVCRPPRLILFDVGVDRSPECPLLGGLHADGQEISPRVWMPGLECLDLMFSVALAVARPRLWR